MVQKIEVFLRLSSGEKRIRMILGKDTQSDRTTKLHMEVDGHHEEFDIKNSKELDIEIHEDRSNPGQYKVSLL